MPVSGFGISAITAICAFIHTDLMSKKANAVFVAVGGGGTFQDSVTYTLVEQK